MHINENNFNDDSSIIARNLLFVFIKLAFSNAVIIQNNAEFRTDVVMMQFSCFFHDSLIKLLLTLYALQKWQCRKDIRIIKKYLQPLYY